MTSSDRDNAWMQASEAHTVRQYKKFVERFPDDTVHVSIAKSRINSLKNQSLLSRLSELAHRYLKKPLMILRSCGLWLGDIWSLLISLPIYVISILLFLPKLFSIIISSNDRSSIEKPKSSRYAYEDRINDARSECLATSVMSCGSSCFVATAVLENEDHPDLVSLRALRDTVLSKKTAGRIFIYFYYKYGSYFANFISDRPYWKKVVKNMIIRPCAWLAKKITGI